MIELPLPFVLGILALERGRLRRRSCPRRAAKAAIEATGTTILIELAGAMGVIATSVVAVVAR